jgi:hypothetical protein
MNGNRPAALARYGPLREWNTENLQNFDRALAGYMFRGGQGAGEDDDITGWNTSAATVMSDMFDGCRTFNQLLRFDTHNVRRMDAMFRGCTAFNQPLIFDTRAVTSMRTMFAFCATFNQPVHFDTHAVTSMWSMFVYCTAFNQPLAFDTHNVEMMGDMFANCTAFNQPLHKWHHQPSVRGRLSQIIGMFKNCRSFNSPVFAMSVNDYDASRLGTTPLGQSAVMEEALRRAERVNDPAEQGRIILLASLRAARVLGAPVHDPEMAALRRDADAYGYRADRHDDAVYLPPDDDVYRARDDDDGRRVRPRYE